jgi:polysaccharide biosynthesis transport protein
MADQRGVLPALARRAWLIGLCAVLAGGSALVWSLREPGQYEATAELLVASGRAKGVPPWRVAANNPELIAQDSVAKRAAGELGEGVTGARVLDSVEVEGSAESDVISVTATDSDPQFAAQLANAFAESAGPAVKPNDAQILTRAEVPSLSSSPNVTTAAAVGAILGVLLGAVLALLMDRLDRRVRSTAELEEAFGLPVLGAVPQSRALASFVDGAGSNKGPPAPPPFVEAEAFKMLAARLRHLGVDRESRSVIVTSALPREGKTTIAANLAMTEADTGSRVLLVEADLRRPALAAAEGLQRLPGLAELLTGQSTLDVTLQQVADHSNGERAARPLEVIVAGNAPSNPVELLESTKMATLLGELSGRYDLVVVDGPPVAVLADTIPLITRAGGVVVVAQLRKVTEDDVARLRDQLRSLDARVLGVVANRVPKGREHAYSYYYGSDQLGPRARFGLRRASARDQDGSRSQAPASAAPIQPGTGERPDEHRLQGPR